MDEHLPGPPVRTGVVERQSGGCYPVCALVHGNDIDQAMATPHDKVCLFANRDRRDFDQKKRPLLRALESVD